MIDQIKNSPTLIWPCAIIMIKHWMTFIFKYSTKVIVKDALQSWLGNYSLKWLKITFNIKCINDTLTL